LGRQITVGTTGNSVEVRILDSSGNPVTNVVAATAGLVLRYRRDFSAVVGISPLTNLAALTTAYTSGGLLHIADGYYRVDIPDAACAVGQRGVLITGTATGLTIIGERIDLVAYNPYDGANLGLTTLSNTATLTQIKDAVADDVYESQGSITHQQAISIMLAILAGRTTTGGLVFQTPNGAATRATATVDASNNRTAMTLSPST
jgi:hypothetical protein